ncbi:MAG: alginate export family protein [Acidobacteria bacterium]|nr:alginate export family protein [Acidobacteriota bacterium]
MRFRRSILFAVLGPAILAAQFPDFGPVRLSFEQRERYESREGMNFGRDPDLFTGLARTRFGVTWKAAGWLKLSAMAQDSRAPWYGPNAPNSARDPLDLQESYAELFGDRKTGFGLSAGRRMISYGESRLIGSPPWGNLGRTWDHARLWYRLPKAQFEVLLASPVKVRIGEFNRPVLGDRIWGTYNAFPNFHGKKLLEVYLLRHDQTRPGGFTGAGRLGINRFGVRLAGPLAAGAKYSVESVLQTGKVGEAAHRAGAWFSSLGRQWKLGSRTLDLAGEYKFASGTNDPTKSGTFDQMYPANHDKLGHQDLIGWRNIHHARGLATFGWTKNLAANFMYSSFWLASARDALYNSAGRAIVRSPGGTAGRHAGQEADLFATYRHGHFQFGAGYGYFFPGGFVKRTTPGLRPTYLYLTHTVSF